MYLDSTLLGPLNFDWDFCKCQCVISTPKRFPMTRLARVVRYFRSDRETVSGQELYWQLLWWICHVTSMRTSTTAAKMIVTKLVLWAATALFKTIALLRYNGSGCRQLKSLGVGRYVSCNTLTWNRSKGEWFKY